MKSETFNSNCMQLMRFYPPNRNDGDFWEGNFYVYLLGKEISRQSVKADTLNELKDKVEGLKTEYVKSLMQKLNL
jgi:hypothetical protein